MAFYDEMAVVALDMITEFGQPVTLRDTNVGSYDPSTGTNAPDIVLEQVAKSMLLEYKGYEFQNATLIQQGDRKLKIPAVGLQWPPTLKTKAVIQGRTWSVVNVKEISPAGIPILYELQVRS